MNYSETEIKFCLCFGIPVETLRNRLHEESFYNEKGINVEEFKDMMIRHRMKEYTAQVLACFYLFSEFLIINKEEQIGLDEYDNTAAEIIKLLIFLFSDENGKNESITFSKSKNSRTLKNQSTINILTDRVIEEFEEYFPETKDFPEDGSDLDFLKMLQRYNDFYKRRSGAKPKNKYIAGYGWHLASLKRIDRFLNQNEISDFRKFPFKNDDYRFIHDCLTFFGMIENKSTNKNNSTPEKYISTMLKQTGPLDKFGIIECINEYKANKILAH